MPLWTAKCWLGSKSGYNDIEVNAATYNGAREQLTNIYGAEQIINLRKVSEKSGGSDSSFSSAGVWGIGALITLALIVMLLPWFMMAIFGAGGTWIGEKLTEQTVAEYCEQENSTKEQTKKALITLCLALLCGGFGFIQGNSWTKYSGTQSSQVEEVRTK